jgi:hypothetical protein
MTAPLSSYAMTKEQYDEVMATRNRPLTDEPMRIKPADMRAVAPDTGDVIDDVMGEIGAAALARFTARRLARQQGENFA